MARYPEVSTFIMVDLSNEESRTIYNEMQLWSGALINELDTRDTEVDSTPSTTVLTVTTVTDIGAPIAGNIAFSTGESKFKGYDGTNWQDLH
tara:strand:- start:1087 stop:1362 length:276 start_codon:yes stop_codon:yes gene_type:complete